MPYLTLALLWAAWCALHSAMISITLTSYLKKKLHENFRFYRLFFNLFAAVTVVPIVLFDQSFHGAPILHWSGPFRILQWLLVGTSLVLFVTGWRHYDMNQLVGFSQMKLANGTEPIEGKRRLKTTGILGVTRHPWYLATVILIWSLDLTVADLVRNTVLTAYVILGTVLEERKLVLEFGSDYHDYQRKVSMLFPWKWVRGLAGQ